ncbi:sensor histidine kinase [Flavobacterium sp.]|uniref:sensor histidine kinase n=1 Tax=Flavobacterium sp. TaxID=239 RepID=UPI002FDECEF6
MEGSDEIKSFFWIGTFMMMFLAFILLFMVSFYQRHFAKMKQKETELLLKTALESEKQERQRIAKDLHDSVQSDLSAIRNYFLLLSRKIRDSQNQILLEEMKIALEQTIENTRLISYKLMPPLLENGGFVMAVQDYFETLSKSSDKNFALKEYLEDFVVSTAIAYELFRIVQEFTSNMLKHGTISECNLFIYETIEGISLELVDDGVSFDFKSSYAQSKGSGLQNIQSRLSSIGAKLVQREVTSGNHFVIYLPKEI